MITQCTAEVRNRNRHIRSDLCSKWTEWERCPNEGGIILQLKGGKNIRVCLSCALKMGQQNWVGKEGKYDVFRRTQYGGKP
jgi:hypothetical protein